MNEKVLKTLRISMFVFSILFFVSNISAQDVLETAIQKAIDELPSYKDVPSSISCKKPLIKAEKIICGSSYLRLMEILDTRAAIYAYENGTKQELNHKNTKQYSLIQTIKKLKTEQAIRKAYIEHTNDSLGGISPYYKD